MSKRLLAVGVLVAVVGALMPVASAKQERSGNQFSLVLACLNENSAIKGVETPMAGEPFHIAHGFAEAPNLVNGLGQYDFDLWVDGVSQKGKLDVTTSNGDDGNVVQRTFVYNYPDGLSAGSHSVRAVWSDSSGVALDCEWDLYFIDPIAEDVDASVSFVCEGASTRLTVTNTGQEPVVVELFGYEEENQVVAVDATIGPLPLEDSVDALFAEGWDYEWQIEYPIGTHIWDNGGGTIETCPTP